MSSLPSILPGPSERAVFAGSTGSGKTYAMLKLAGWYFGKKQIIVIDTKGDSSIKRLKAPVATVLLQMSKYDDPRKHPLVVFRPTGAAMADPATFNQMFEWVFRRGHTMVLIDEASQVSAGSTQPSVGMLDMVTRGRDRGVQVWSATQRPVGVPVILLSECEVFFCFSLRRRGDRRTMDDYTRDGFAEMVPDDPGAKHAFAWYRQGETPRVFRSITQGQKS